MKCLISSPYSGEVVGSRIRVKGVVHECDLKQRLWTACRRTNGGAYWPKESEIALDPSGTFDVLVHESGAPGEVIVSILAVSDGTAAAFENWLAEGHRTGEYSGISPHTHKIQEIASVSVTYSRQRPLRLFISYAHKDENYREALEEHLVMLRRQRIVETWHDRMISAGTDFPRAIDAKLKTADVVLLLVSASFLASDYCYEKEMALALERHESGESRIMPVIIRACDWETTPFSHLLALPKDGRSVRSFVDPDEAWLEVVQGLKIVIEELK